MVLVPVLSCFINSCLFEERVSNRVGVANYFSSNVDPIIEPHLKTCLPCPLTMAWAVKRRANEPLTGLFIGPLTARFYVCLLLGCSRAANTF